MYTQSRITVWYQIASQKIILGEALSSGDFDVVSLWLHSPFDDLSAATIGYRLSLFDDDGREIGNKAISDSTADTILGSGMAKARV